MAEVIPERSNSDLVAFIQSDTDRAEEGDSGSSNAGLAAFTQLCIDSVAFKRLN